MVKHEIKVELDKSKEILTLIEKSYFEEGMGGKILKKEHFIKIDKEDDVNWVIFNGLNNATVKISNQDVIDGTMRFVINQTQDEIRLYPISIYCIKEEDRYIFY